MKYVTVTAKTNSGGEAFINIWNSSNILPNVSKYVGVLYRNAPGGKLEFYSSSNTIEFNLSESFECDTSEGWHFAVLNLTYLFDDSVCRRLRFDFFNELDALTEYSMDLAFVKSFTSIEEAKAYYQSYVETYDLNS
jgi:hypothetical protein